MMLQQTPRNFQDVQPIEFSEGTSWRTLVTDAWYLVLAFLAVVGLLMRSRRSFVQRWSVWRRRRRESELRYFKSALRSARSGEAPLALRDIMRRLDDREAPAQLQCFARLYAGDDAQVIVDMLLNAAATDGRLSKPTAVIELLNTLRQRWRDARRPRPEHAVVLPELNH